MLVQKKDGGYGDGKEAFLANACAILEAKCTMMGRDKATSCHQL